MRESGSTNSHCVVGARPTGCYCASEDRRALSDQNEVGTRAALTRDCTECIFATG